jgi:HipA-like kinase
MPRLVTATRYVAPLREGGSLPAIVEADDDGLYVVKFRGAGHGAKALVAELIAGEIGRALGLQVPDIVLVDLDPALAAGEPDAEIRELLQRSAGINVGLDFLPGALGFDPAAGFAPDADLSANVVWFDALVTNVDRTARNTNLLVWHRRLWLIDHGSALYVHHTWREPQVHARRPFPQSREHVLLPGASSIRDADGRLAPRLTRQLLESIVADVPDEWLMPQPGLPDAGAHRRAYVEYVWQRLAEPRAFVEEAERARPAA